MHLRYNSPVILTFTLLAPGVADSNAMADDTDYRTVQTRPSGRPPIRCGRESWPR